MDDDPPRLLIIGDPHLQIKYTDVATCAVKDSIALVKQLLPDAVVVLGDILHTHEYVHIQMYKLAVTWFELMAEYCPVYVLIGNHDYIDAMQYLTDNHIFGEIKHVHNITVVDHVVHARIKNHLFVMCPYVEPGLFKSALDTAPGWEDATCIFGHQEFYNVAMEGINSAVGDVWSPDYPPVITGHIHKAQDLYPNIHYPGSMVQVSHGDMEDKFVWLATFYLDGTWTRYKYTLSNVRSRKTISMPFDQVNTLDLTLASKYILRVILTGTHDEKAAFTKSKWYDTIRAHKIKLDYKLNKRTTTTPYVDIGRTHKSFDAIVGELIKTRPEHIQTLYMELKSQGVL